MADTYSIHGNYIREGSYPLDVDCVKASLSALDSYISDGSRCYGGQLVYVTSNKKLYKITTDDDSEYTYEEVMTAEATDEMQMRTTGVTLTLASGEWYYSDAKAYKGEVLFIANTGSTDATIVGATSAMGISTITIESGDSGCHIVESHVTEQWGFYNGGDEAITIVLLIKSVAVLM